MIVVGMMGERIGTVERFEIDRYGQLKSLVVRITASIGTRKRIAAAQIRAIRGGTVEVSVSAADIGLLEDLPDQSPIA